MHFPSASPLLSVLFASVLLPASSNSFAGAIAPPFLGRPAPDHALAARQAIPSPGLTTDFQVYEPILTPAGTSDQYGCVYTETLMEYDFAFSYGAPFVGSYTPPPCSFNRVTLNFTVTVRGVQFDRLGLMYLGDIEVFRTSTAEPTRNGIIWTYTKEMQQYNALWNQPQKIIFDLGNLVDSTYTGIFNTTLTATFFTVPNSPPTADTILPISSRSSASNQGSVFTIPGDNASVAYTLPKTIQRAVISLEACGQQAEEFWYTNVFNSEVDTFANTAGSYLGSGTFREVQLLIDGQLAGVSWPFPVIFTGGINPGFWRPLVGIDAFDLRQHEVDITPWLGYLLDGKPHTFGLNVVGTNDDGKGHASLGPPQAYWLVTGTIFIFSGGKKATTGTRPTISTPPPTLAITSKVTTNANGVNETLTYTTTAHRTISISATINGKKSSWTQILSYNNFNQITAEGFAQVTNQTTNGADAALTVGYANTYSYPINVFESFSETAAGVGINASLSRGLDFNVFGPSVIPSGIQTFNITNTPAIFNLGGQTNPAHINIPKAKIPFLSGALLSTTQTGEAMYFSSATNANNSFVYGTTSQDFSFNGAETGPENGVTYELYSRSVEAVNGSVVRDSQQLAGQTFGIPTFGPGNGVVGVGVAPFSAKSILGKGTGKSSVQGPPSRKRDLDAVRRRKGRAVEIEAQLEG